MPGAPDGIRLDESTRGDANPRYYFTAPCPGHDDVKPSFKISTGQHKHLVWRCYAGCSDRKVRHALIELGVHWDCLPRAAAELRDLEESLRALLTSDASHADVRIRAMALLDCPDGHLPEDGSVVQLGQKVHVSRSGSFEARNRLTSGTTK